MARTAAKRLSGGVLESVTAGGPAARAGLRTGDVVVAVNGRAARDLLDVVWAAQDGQYEVTVVRGARTLRRVVRLRPGEHLGVGFEQPVFDRIRRCPNRCVFCFVDQQPAGLRPSLYVKDEDYRLSFLAGAYVTLTNLRDADLERIEELRLSPLYVSVHATDERVRRRLLGNQSIPRILPLLRRLGRAGISFYAQIVLVPGWNDGRVLRETLRDLVALGPALLGLAVVPVGLTAHRGALTPLRPVGARDARQALDAIDRARATATAPVCGADELFLRAGRALPGRAYYGDFGLLENGVGLMRRFLDALERTLRRRRPRPPRDGPPVALVTGEAAAPFFRDQVVPELRRYGAPPVTVVPARNRLLGPSVTVAGLLCGRDVVAALAGLRPARVLLCEYLVRTGTDRLLDDLPLDALRERLGCPVEVVPDDGAALARTLLRRSR